MGLLSCLSNMYNEQIENRAEQPAQTAPNSTATAEPSVFTQPAIVQFINCRRLALFVSRFTPELHAANLTVPDPNNLNGHDTAWFARFFANSGLPENLRKALRTLEIAADPTNEARVDTILARRFPQNNFGHWHPLDRALELWFNVPEELAVFKSNSPASPSQSERLDQPPPTHRRHPRNPAREYSIRIPDGQSRTKTCRSKSPRPSNRKSKISNRK
jgi:hypothetical protein